MNTAKQAVPTEARERAREVLANQVGLSPGTQWLRGYVQLEADAILEAMLQFAADERAEATCNDDLQVADQRAEVLERVALAIGSEMLERSGGELDKEDLVWRGFYGGNWIPFDLRHLARAAIATSREEG